LSIVYIVRFVLDITLKKVAILQSNYVPWKGYFDIVGGVDFFIFHDDLQYTKNDWRNRNKIVTEQGLAWLTIPCGTSEKRLICEVKLSDHSWQKKHYDLILNSYRKAPYLEMHLGFLKSIYLEQNWENLSQFNQYVIKKISHDVLGFKTEFLDSRDFDLKERKEARVLELLKKVEAEEYLSGPAAKDYITEEHFQREQIKIKWMSYSGYPEYKQLHSSPFEHGVSILDLMLNTGPNIKNYMLTL
jgi:hypothetical protein